MQPGRLFRTFFLYLTLSSISLYANIQFNATDEWQVVPDGVDIPAGLHVKMDMSGGGKWAKLLNTSENEFESGNNENTDIVVTKKDEGSRRDMDWTFNKFQEEMAGMDKRGDDERGVRLEKLKAELSERELKSDFEIMGGILNILEEIVDVENEFYIQNCESLDWLLSKVDNAKDAANHGILSRLINLNDIRPSKYIWRLISSSAQNNPPVAKALFEVMRPVLEDNIVSLDSGSPILKSALFTLSAITRALPVEDVIRFNWRLVIDAHGGNEYLCNLLTELGDIPYTCGKTEL